MKKGKSHEKLYYLNPHPPTPLHDPLISQKILLCLPPSLPVVRSALLGLEVGALAFVHRHAFGVWQLLLEALKIKVQLWLIRTTLGTEE